MYDRVSKLRSVNLKQYVIVILSLGDGGHVKPVEQMAARSLSLEFGNLRGSIVDRYPGCSYVHGSLQAA
jgi:hypothetical protein